MIGTAGSHDDVLACRYGQVIIYLRNRICQCEYYWILRHLLQHFGGKHIAYRKTYKYVCLLYGFIQGVYISAGSKAYTVLIQIWPSFFKNTILVEHYYVLNFCS